MERETWSGHKMTPERLQELIALREERDRLSVLFNKARDDWTQACSDLNYALIEELDYYQYIQKIRPSPPEWYVEVKGEKPKKEVKSKRKINAMVKEMLEKTEGVEAEKRKTSFKSLW
jgi:hypothetical protein